MLYITRKCNKSSMVYYDINAWFDNLAELKDDEITKYLLKSIDNAGYVSKGHFVSSMTGEILECSQLSSGCKAALLSVYEADKTINFTEAGDNAFKALLDVAFKTDKDIRIYTNNVVKVPCCDVRVNVDGIVMSVNKFCMQSMERRL